MNKNNFELTKDYIDAISFSTILSISQNKTSIDADEIFLSIFKILQKFSFNRIFLQYLEIENPEDIDRYVQKNYDISSLTGRETIKGGMFDIDANLSKELELFNQKGFKKLDFLCLLYVSSRNLSDKLKKYLHSKQIKVSNIKSKIENLMKNEKIYELGTVNLFNILDNMAKAFDLDIENIKLLMDKEKLEKSQILAELDFDFNLEGENTSSTEEAKITSNPKEEDKKLTIEYFGSDLTKEASEGSLDPFIGREKEINQLIYTLLRKTKNNPLLIGEAGVGKTAIIEGLAQKIVKGEVSEKLRNKKIFILDMGSLLAGTKYRGEFEARFKAILEEASDPTQNIILFIDEIHTIIGAGNAEGSADAANMLKPLLSRGKIQLIGATTFDEYQKHIEKDPALKRRFQEIVVEEPTDSQTEGILAGLKDKFEEFHGVNISPEAIRSSIELSTRYILNKHLPDKAIDLLDEASARKSTLNEKLKNNDEYLKAEDKLKKIAEKIERAIAHQDYFTAAELKEKEEELKSKMKNMRAQNVLPKDLRPNVDANDIGVVLADKLGIPENEINKSEIDKLRNLDSQLKEKILGQDEAVDEVVKSIRRNRLSIIKKNKPIASFLFLGPSGVGKTYIAKLLAQDFFGDPKSLIRVDMSEFMERHSASKLIGSAPGYVGYDEGGVLTEAVRRRPYSVVLFDEIEKASPEVLNILLQVMDEGHLKDNKGRWIDFKNTIIILTSNIGSAEFGKKIPKIGFNTAGQDAGDRENDKFKTIKAKVLESLKNHLTPEMINRLDYIVVYKPLSKEILTKIFKQKLEDFTCQWQNQKGIKIPKFDDKKISGIIDEIYQPEFGARPIEKYIYDKIEPDLINQILAEGIKPSKTKC